MLSNILVSLIEADGQTAKVISTEDLLSRVEEFNELIRTGQVDGEGLTLGSLDVEALYPSIDTKLAAKIIKERILETQLRFEGID